MKREPDCINRRQAALVGCPCGNPRNPRARSCTSAPCSGWSGCFPGEKGSRSVSGGLMSLPCMPALLSRWRVLDWSWASRSRVGLFLRSNRKRLECVGRREASESSSPCSADAGGVCRCRWCVQKYSETRMPAGLSTHAGISALCPPRSEEKTPVQ